MLTCVDGGRVVKGVAPSAKDLFFLAEFKLERHMRPLTLTMPLLSGNGYEVIKGLTFSAVILFFLTDTFSVLSSCMSFRLCSNSISSGKHSLTVLRSFLRLPKVNTPRAG